jgi:hypothetical protein
MPRRRVRLWLWPALVIVGVAALSVIGFFRWLWPPVPLSDPNVLSYWQLVVGYWSLALGATTILLAAIFGPFAIEQVRLGQQGLRDDRAAREDALLVENRQILFALLLELANNYEAVIRLEGRLVATRLFREPPPPTFAFATFQSLSAGPLWRLQLQRLGDIWPKLAEVYLQLQRLDQRLRRFPGWWPFAVGGFLFGWATLSETLPRSARLPAASAAASGALLYQGWLRLGANATGDVTRARLALEAALDQLTALLPGATSWRADVGKDVAPGWRLRSADEALASWWTFWRHGDYRAAVGALGLLFSAVWALVDWCPRRRIR